jgi:hypothetical protein
MGLVNLLKHIYNFPSNRIAELLKKFEAGDRAGRIC